jgi:tRNA nucleotidyltransferase (CCA-adding enzyme)
MKKRAVPVVGEDRKLLGFLKYRDPVKAAQTKKGSQCVKAWMRREVRTVEPDTPFTKIEALLLEGTTGSLHVVDDDHRLLGLVSRTDMLRQCGHYKSIMRRLS